MGWLYLLCFERGLSGGGNSHYLGYASKSVNKRIAQHAAGTAGAVFTTEAHRQEIAFRVGGIWRGCTPRDERRMKNQKQHRRYCKLCTPDTARRVPPMPRAQYEKRRLPTPPPATTNGYDDLEDLDCRLPY